MHASPWDRIGSIAVAVAAPIVIVGVAIVIFLNPVWVYFEQDRSGVDRFTGFSATEVRQVTGAILSDLVFGPPSFDVALNGQPVLDVKERQHMADVRTVFMQLGAVVLVAAIVFVAATMIGWRRRWFWRGLFAGSVALVVGVIVVGLAFTVFFDQTFTLMHELFFAPGSWTFAGTERLIQLFPDQFWSDTTVAVSVAVLALGLGSAFVADRRLRATANGLSWAGPRL